MFSSTQIHIQIDALLNLAYVAVITVIEYLPSLPEMTICYKLSWRTWSSGFGFELKIFQVQNPSPKIQLKMLRNLKLQIFKMLGKVGKFKSYFIEW